MKESSSSSVDVVCCCLGDAVTDFIASVESDELLRSALLCKDDEEENVVDFSPSLLGGCELVESRADFDSILRRTTSKQKGASSSLERKFGGSAANVARGIGNLARGSGGKRDKGEEEDVVRV